MPPSQLSFESIPKDPSRFELLESGATQEMVEVAGRICQLLGLPRSTGQIFGLLYLSAAPLSLNQLSARLGISKGSASIGTRKLASWGAIRKVWIPGNRRDFYEVIEDLGQLIRGSYNNIFKPRVQSSKNRLVKLERKLDADIKSGLIPAGNKEILERRIKALVIIHGRIMKMMPYAEKIIGER